MCELVVVRSGRITQSPELLQDRLNLRFPRASLTRSQVTLVPVLPAKGECGRRVSRPVLHQVGREQSHRLEWKEKRFGALDSYFSWLRDRR